MRAKEFLVEYNRQVTIQNWGQKLLAAIKKDPAYQQLSINWGHVPEGPINGLINKVIAVIENADPTPHKEYVQWLCKIYSLGTVKLEDLESRGKDALENFNMLKLKKIMPPIFRDINRYRSLDQLMVEVDHYMKQIPQEVDVDKGTHNVLLDDENLRIIVPLNVAAAKYYGQGTTWCTAAKNNNRFEQYNKEGNLYILLPKQPAYVGEKYQFHFQASQFMNEQDHPIDVMKLVKRWPELQKTFAAEAESSGYIPLMRAGPQIVQKWPTILAEAIKWSGEKVEHSFPGIINSVRAEMHSEAMSTVEESRWVARATAQALQEDYMGLMDAMAQFITPANYNDAELLYDQNMEDVVTNWIQDSAIGIAVDKILDNDTHFDAYAAQLSLLNIIFDGVMPVIRSEIKYIISTYY